MTRREFLRLTDTELGNNPQPQLYDLATDIGERRNVAALYPAQVDQLATLLRRVRDQGGREPQPRVLRH